MDVFYNLNDKNITDKRILKFNFFKNRYNK